MVKDMRISKRYKNFSFKVHKKYMNDSLIFKYSIELDFYYNISKFILSFKTRCRKYKEKHIFKIGF